MSYCKFVHCKSFLELCQEMKYNVLYRCTETFVFVFSYHETVFRDILVAVHTEVSLVFHHIFVHNLTFSTCL